MAIKLVKTILIIVISFFVIFTGFYKFINSTNYQVAGEIISQIDTDKKIVALTFDDGPNENADEILKILDEKNVKATFYLIGEQIESNPDQIKKIVSSGHEIGNHSYTHTRMVFKSFDFIAEEIQKTNNLIRESSYSGEITFRPPYGKKLFSLPIYLSNQNIKTIMWDLDPLQTLPATASSQEISDFVISNAKSGSIILIHPWHGVKNNSRDAISLIIDGLKKNGFEFVTVNQLISAGL